MKETNRMADSGKTEIPINEKYMLTIKEASEYFNIGIKNMRRMAEENTGFYAVFLGNRYLIVRKKFEKYMDALTMGKEEDAE
ncbi:DNA binding domain, excisionase family [Marvinbryantia formatexigens DSM 14469]|uniref:DNA binding domain, excisionase family n=1 Tax=Marvinbryantia formatexigens DSM 14469 TaxID=478749 RepID=C6LMA7_9FIRM|nr:excisionase [Marvinbryantia formatexigens]EET58248.1 DNA binding domain, excisionase family [Marvinbryantia formatexigens DSM 14469]UWO23973.1 excisionase [Marvinbryantia formatexigens DSM 14469]SDH22338.1 DNA binding domain-containing protein, excisionase family [Marvinbryantia formatexigens]